jgi:hypothetical protein
MTWESLIMRKFTRCSEKREMLTSHIDALFTHQKNHWQRLHDNIRNLALIETKTLTLGHFDIYAQYNPARMQNTTAKVDQTSVQQRRCKLCPDQLFPEQKGVAYGDEFVILCNPYPILDRHLSIVDRTHIPQAIEGRLPSLLELARDLSREFVLFYNGPKCGASTPEHFHVQVCASRGVPVLRHCARILQDPALHRYKRNIRSEEGLEVFILKDYHACLVVYQGTDPHVLRMWVEHTIRQFAALTGKTEEPLLNLLVWFDDPIWNIYLFPRASHRPACYFDGTLTVSPASLDMAGCMVVPVKKHFHTICEESVRQVYTEVSVEPHVFARLIRAITS